MFKVIKTKNLVTVRHGDNHDDLTTAITEAEKLQAQGFYVTIREEGRREPIKQFEPF